MATTVTVRSGEELRQLKVRATDSGVIGQIVARVLESQSQRAFLEQKLGDFAWPERYPSQEDPFVNIAALVNFTNDGGTIRSRFFDRRPALMGTGDLAGSISGTVKGDLVILGSSKSYAGIHQWGGTSSQPVTETAKKTIARFIGFEKKDGKWKRKKKLGSKQEEQSKKYHFKLLPLLAKDQLETQVNQRPFLGITEDNEQEMVDTIEAYVAHGKGG